MRTSFNPNSSYEVSGRLLNEIGRGVNLSQSQLNNTISHSTFSHYGFGEVCVRYYDIKVKELPAFSPVRVESIIEKITDNDDFPVFIASSVNIVGLGEEKNASLFVNENTNNYLWGITLSPVKNGEITAVRLNGFCKCRIKTPAEDYDTRSGLCAIPDFINGSSSYLNVCRLQNYKIYPNYGAKIIAYNSQGIASDDEKNNGFVWAIIELNQEANKCIYGMFDVTKDGDNLLCYNSLDLQSDVAGLVNINGTYFKVLKQSFSFQAILEKNNDSITTTRPVAQNYLVIHFIPPKYDYNAENEDEAYIAGECKLEILTNDELDDISSAIQNVFNSMDAYYIIAIIYVSKDVNNKAKCTIEHNHPAGIIAFPWYSGHVDMLADSVKPGYFSVADDKNVFYK